MHPLNKKIPAFTLSEMMVVLVISAIVISLAITVLNLVQQQIRSIQNNYELNSEIRILERALYYDFHQYNLFYNAKDSVLTASNALESKHYYFSKNYVLRNSDTIRVSIREINLFLHGNLVKKGSIDALSLTIPMNPKPRELFVFKQHAAAYYMNSNGL